MDYYALSELVVLSLVGLSVLTLAVGFSVRMFIAPTLREILGNRASPGSTDPALSARIDRLEDRLSGIEESLDRLAAASEFDRRLEAAKPDDE